MRTTKLPDELISLQESGFARWTSGETPAAGFRQRFDDKRIPVLGIRHIRQWGVQVDGECELMGREPTSVAD